jgi:RNA polymerase sigma factor (sigma-70 family)
VLFRQWYDAAHPTAIVTMEGVRPDDAELIRGFLEGRAEAHDRIDGWIEEVLRSRHFLLGSDREDVAQEVRRKLLGPFRAGNFLGQARLRTYVWRAAQHAALNHLRGRRRRPTGPLEDVPEPASPGVDPVQALVLEERRSLARRILAGMGEECRRLWALAVFEELPYRAIARQWGVSEAAVKVRALRCRRKAVEAYRRLQAGAAPEPAPERT